MDANDKEKKLDGQIVNLLNKILESKMLFELIGIIYFRKSKIIFTHV